MEASARPAIAFTLTLRNTGQQQANASLLLNMPLQIETDQARPGAALVPAMRTADSSLCAEQCDKNEACNSWIFVALNTSCQLQSGFGLNSYRLGSDSGVRGRWTVDADGRCVTLLRPGHAPTSGNISLCASSAIYSQAGAHSRLGTVLKTFGAAGTLGLSDANGQQGAVMLSAAVPPGSNASTVSRWDGDCRTETGTTSTALESPAGVPLHAGGVSLTIRQRRQQPQHTMRLATMLLLPM